MSKINNKILLVVLLVLIGAYFGNKYLNSKGERNFRSVLVAIDTSKVDKILLSFPSPGESEIIIEKTEVGKFLVSNDKVSDEADIGMIRGMLSSHLNMKPERIVANSADRWDQYEVSDSTGVNVKMFSGNELLSEVIVGKFDFQQATRTMNTMVRIAEEDAVYAVEGFLSSNFKVDINALRDKTFLKSTDGSIRTIRADYPNDSSFVLTSNNGNWFVDGEPADSTESAKFVNGLGFLNLRDFVDDFSPNPESLLYQLTIEGDSLNTITIDCYKPADEYILHSSLNENAYFKPGGNNIFEKLFPAREKFYPKSD